jgi:hypothetical protein
MWGSVLVYFFHIEPGLLVQDKATSSGCSYRPHIAGVWIGDDPSRLPLCCSICDKLRDQPGAVDLGQHRRPTQEIIYAQGAWWLCTPGLLGCFRLLDRALYLPQEWTNDRDRCRQAGISDDRRFATKPQLARQMQAHTFAAGS